LLHYLPNYLRYEPDWWEQYQNVNRTFAEKVLEVAKEGDLVWVHDYQLMLLPAMLRAAAPNLRIGFFLPHALPCLRDFPLPSAPTRISGGNAGREQGWISRLWVFATLL